MAVDVPWRPISELPESGDRPGRQFVYLEGVCHHSGMAWGRQHVGTAYTGDGQQGYREDDIRRLLAEGDMDFGEVTYWAPFAVDWPTLTPRS